MHIADLLRASHRLGVVVEFSRSSDVTAVVLWKSVARSLAYEYGACRRVIVSKLKSGDLDLANATSSQVFNELVAEPLRQLTASDTVPRDRLPVIVIDALDECGGLGISSWKAREDILECIADWAKLAPGVKLIVTSRAEQDIKQAFSKIPHTPLEIPTGSSTTDEAVHDIQLYMKDEFTKIATLNDIAGDWPGDETIEDLSRRAEGVFIWAVTVVNFIDDLFPRRQLKMIQDGKLPSGNIYRLYRQILNTSFSLTTTSLSNDFVVVVGAIVVLRQAFTSSELSQLLEMELDTIKGICRGLRTVLVDIDCVQFRHQSFVDFLTGASEQEYNLTLEDPFACPNRFRINVADAHGRICESLFRLMHKELHFNICCMPSSLMYNSELPRSHFTDAIGRTVAYACQHWGYHLSKSRLELNHGLITTFICEDLLFWFEGLSGLQNMIVAVPSLKYLEEQLASSTKQVKRSLSILNRYSYL